MIIRDVQEHRTCIQLHRHAIDALETHRCGAYLFKFLQMLWSDDQ